MVPTVDIVALAHWPVAWIALGVVAVACLIGWRLAHKTYWRVLLALGLAAVGVSEFVDGIESAHPPGFWAPQGAILLLGAGLLLDRARRLHKLERLTNRHKP